ncbi:hypothetical protein EDB92DRAFT_1894873 [Lactarius akahatsu]|uniref:Peptide N-acetyl-beta-D-glucosaminyl asparaginase amidase A N-terminal domain-containing protein n=1 Tax=Lactarius akahatsu TaxID=416441 RepID=A0AAD4LAA5_9AGAM|nr:hypothetical protein EDB92DRAFT_1894873 [Lactarius akahatsu]
MLCTNYALCDPLVNFQVAQPPPFVLDSESLQCTIPIIQSVSLSRSFQPPTGCSTPNVWGGVTLNLTVTSNGTQYPRFAFFTFQNVEIWRSSTPIPNNLGSDGIVWTSTTSSRPDSTANTPVEVTLPQNAVTAFAELQASASGRDTFWVCLPSVGSLPALIVASC